MTHRRIVVTGGSGFIGTNLVQHLLDAGHAVVNLDLAAPRCGDHREHWRKVDLLDPDAAVGAVIDFGPDVICHLAARIDLAGATVEDYRVNTDGVRNIVAAARAAGTVGMVAFGSSQLVCTPGHVPVSDVEFSPPNAYGMSKVVGEQIVRSETADAFPWVLLRPTTIWGPWFGEIYSAFFRSVQRGRYMHPRGVRVRKAFGFVGNTVHQISQIISQPSDAVHGRVFYLTDYEPYPILEWADMIRREFGSRKVREVPLPLLRVLAVGGDALLKVGIDHPPLTSYRLRNMLTATSFDTTELQAICGEAPFTLEEGTRLTVDWLREQSRA